MIKRKRKQTDNQRKAAQRNWSKGAIKGMGGQFKSMRSNKALSFSEQIQVIRCEKILKELLVNWSPTI